jgi:hypothetical protein
MNVHLTARQHLPATAGPSADHDVAPGGGQHHALDTVAAALTVPVEVVASIFTTTHHDSWEDAVARYDHDHPAAHHGSGTTSETVDERSGTLGDG